MASRSQRGGPPAPDHPEIESLPALDAALSSGAPLRGLRIQGLDLTAYETRLLVRDDMEGLVVLGGELSPQLDEHLRAHHALVFPTDPRAPINPYRSTLYQPHELYQGLQELGYAATPDFQAYRWAHDAANQRDVLVTLLRAIHDDSMNDALTEFLGPAPVVGVMGGHAVPRDSRAYAVAARLGHGLASAGLVVATGGGPGAMEAANLGALSPSERAMSDAVTRVATVPGFGGNVRKWATVALEVYDELVRQPAEGRVRSVGIPTWFYGHEPPNVFCNGIGKYFSNAIREDGLLARCTAGLVVLAGAAGTVQEIFQAATRLYYARDVDRLPPLVLVGRRYWSEDVPLWPALRSLGRSRPMGRAVHLVDSAQEALRLLTG
jgi:predicted Rossmann-fold nucleotide-binding protein